MTIRVRRCTICGKNHRIKDQYTSRICEECYQKKEGEE